MSFHSISARLAAFTVFAGLLLVTIAAVGLLGGKRLSMRLIQFMRIELYRWLISFAWPNCAPPTRRKSC